MKKLKTEERTSWFGAKCIFVYPSGSLDAEQVYEERVILLKAMDFDQAIARAEKDAHSYAEERCIYTGFVDVFRIFDDDIGEDTEVYSLMRTSALTPNKYLDHFYDTGTERTQ